MTNNNKKTKRLHNKEMVGYNTTLARGEKYDCPLVVNVASFNILLLLPCGLLTAQDSDSLQHLQQQHLPVLCVVMLVCLYTNEQYQRQAGMDSQGEATQSLRLSEQLARLPEQRNLSKERFHPLNYCGI